LKSGRTSAPRLPQAAQVNRGSNPTTQEHKGRSGKDAQAYFEKCVEKDGKVDNTGSIEAK